MKLPQPLAVFDIALAPGHVVHISRVEAVVFKSRKDVEVHVRDLLSCHGSIRQKRLDVLDYRFSGGAAREHPGRKTSDNPADQ
jgi:hypothetical protein